MGSLPPYPGNSDISAQLMHGGLIWVSPTPSHFYHFRVYPSGFYHQLLCIHTVIAIIAIIVIAFEMVYPRKFSLAIFLSGRICKDNGK